MVAEHRAILDALAARDADAAGRLLGAHVLRTGSEVIEVLLRLSAASERVRSTPISVESEEPP